MVERRDVGSWLDGPGTLPRADPAHPGARMGRPEKGPGSLASIERRFLALLVDWAIAVVIGRAVLSASSQALHGAGSLVPLGILLLEHTLLVGTAGATIGHRLLRTRVETPEGGFPGPARALVRGVLLCLALPAVTTFFDPDRRGLHDRAAGTVVARR